MVFLFPNFLNADPPITNTDMFVHSQESGQWRLFNYKRYGSSVHGLQTVLWLSTVWGKNHGVQTITDTLSTLSHCHVRACSNWDNISYMYPYNTFCTNTCIECVVTYVMLLLWYESNRTKRYWLWIKQAGNWSQKI